MLPPIDPVSHWWNGTWGRLARRDVHLRTGQVWQVELREGGADGRSRVLTFDNEADGRTYLRRALAADERHWKELPL